MTDFHFNNIECECSICLEYLFNNIKLLKCGHNFHTKCLQSWLDVSKIHNCPICRNKIEILRNNTPLYLPERDNSISYISVILVFIVIIIIFIIITFPYLL
jgi:hypothetical protein